MTADDQIVLQPVASMVQPSTTSELVSSGLITSTVAIGDVQARPESSSARPGPAQGTAHTPQIQQGQTVAAGTATVRRDGSVHDRQSHRRHSRRHQNQQSLASWIWLKLCCHIRRSTIDFFDAVDAGRVDAVRAMVKSSPAMLLRTRPGTRWTAVHFAAERGEFSTLCTLFNEAQHLDERSVGSRSRIGCTGIGVRPSIYTKCMVSALTEKNLTPLMLACKRGCATSLIPCTCFSGVQKKA